MLGVYLITNTITGRTYVGRSGHTVWRIKSHLDALRCGYHPCELMCEDSYTFGYESFECKVLGYYDDDEAARMETFMMKLLRTQDKRYGYNYRDKSGNCPNAVKDRWRTPPRAWQPIFRRKFLEGKTKWRVNRLPYHEPEPIPESVRW